MQRTILLVVALLAIAGCTGPGAAPSPTQTDTVPTVEPFPSPPAEVTADTVGDWVGTFEAAYRHNTILATAGVDRITSISTSCDPVNTTERPEGFTVEVECGFSYMYEDDGSVAVADGVPYRATYLVTDGGLIERVGSTLAR